MRVIQAIGGACATRSTAKMLAAREQRPKRSRVVLSLLLLGAMGIAGLTTAPPARATTHVAISPHDGSVIVSAWGADGNSQLGTAPGGVGRCVLGNACSQTAIVVNGVGAVTGISAGGFHSLAVAADGSVWAWGGNTFGQLGNNSTVDSAAPVQVIAPSITSDPVIAVSAGGMHSLALTKSGAVWAWGANFSGQAGSPGVKKRGLKSRQPVLAPIQVIAPNAADPVIAIAAGGRHSLALTKKGAVWAWGDNTFGQLGTSNNTSSKVPVKILSDGSGVTAIAAGALHSLALKGDGTVWSWGANFTGQLGNGSTGSNAGSLVPTQVPGLTGVEEIAAGALHSLALEAPTDASRAVHNGIAATAGTVVAWGYNRDGELGPGVASSTDCRCVVSPTNTSLTNVLSIAAGGQHSLAIASDNTAWAWGSNASGQLGAATSSTMQSTPIQVAGLSGVTEVVAGGTFSLALGTAPVFPPTATPTTPPDETQTAAAQQTSAAETVQAAVAAQQTTDAQTAAAQQTSGAQTAAAQQTTDAQTAAAQQTAVAQTSAAQQTTDARTAAAQTATAQAEKTGAAQTVEAAQAAETAAAAAETAAADGSAAQQTAAAQTVAAVQAAETAAAAAQTVAVGGSAAQQAAAQTAAAAAQTVSAAETAQAIAQETAQAARNVAVLNAVVPPSSTPQTAPSSTPQTAPSNTPITLGSVTFGAPAPPKFAKPATTPKKLTGRLAKAFLSLNLPKLGIISGRTFSVRLTTAPHAHVLVTLEVFGTKQVFVGKGKKRHKVTQRVVIFRVTKGGLSDAHGLYNPKLAVGFKTRTAVQAVLIITTRTSAGTATSTLKVMIKPPSKPSHKRK